ncbi:restriction endonuclease [Enterococcus canis]|jgi:HIRAN domain.|uniref:Restriction endonuclease n=1 Tax=Enterococcus canis TaxID=214095 RepID=A0A1L8RGA2_9ENTE|nr:HIRAN domain-containing protein [Enterococcus canis]OJG18735.1 restriction endonuclease [Enterococcus canis]
MSEEFVPKAVFESIRQQRYEPSRFFMDFHIAGFAYYDGLEVIEELKLGTVVTLVGEPDNPHDPDAVAIYYQGKKLGYIPSSKNTMFSTFLYFGHSDLFEARIQTVNLEHHPERQFRVVVRVKDQRHKA